MLDYCFYKLRLIVSFYFLQIKAIVRIGKRVTKHLFINKILYIKSLLNIINIII